MITSRQRIEDLRNKRDGFIQVIGDAATQKEKLRVACEDLERQLQCPDADTIGMSRSKRRFPHAQEKEDRPRQNGIALSGRLFADSFQPLLPGQDSWLLWEVLQQLRQPSEQQLPASLEVLQQLRQPS